jgi:hypothetical protein
MESKSFFHITAELEALQNEIELNGGELSEETLNSLELTESALKVKSESYIHFIKHLENNIALAKEYKEQAEKVIRQRTYLIEKLKEKLLTTIIRLELDEIKTDLFRISTRKSESIDITDESAIPNEYKVFEPKVDKAAIKKAIKEGLKVSGAILKENKNLSIK